MTARSTRIDLRGAEFFEDSRTLRLPEEMQVRISRWIFENDERGEVPMLDQAEIERLGNLPPLRSGSSG